MVTGTASCASLFEDRVFSRDMTAPLPYPRKPLWNPTNDMASEPMLTTLALYALTFVGGVLSTIVTTAFINRRALFTYRVSHSQIGVSGEDPIYGTVQVLWNNKPIESQLYLSTVEVTNTSTRDFDDVDVTIYSSSTELLTEKSELVNTTRIIDYSENYKRQLDVADGENPSPSQSQLHARRREYYIPAMVRGQVARFEYLNAAEAGARPAIHAEVIRSGIKVRQKADEPKIWGESTKRAAVAGTLLCSMVVVLVLYYVGPTYTAAVGVFVLGLAGNIAGALFLKLWRKIRRAWGD